MVKYKSLPPHIEAVFLQNLLKLAAHVFDRHERDERYEDIVALIDLVNGKFSESVKSAELEVQERSSTSMMMLKIAKDAVLESKLWSFGFKRGVLKVQIICWKTMLLLYEF